MLTLYTGCIVFNKLNIKFLKDYQIFGGLKKKKKTRSGQTKLHDLMHLEKDLWTLLEQLHQWYWLPKHQGQNQHLFLGSYEGLHIKTENMLEVSHIQYWRNYCITQVCIDVHMAKRYIRFHVSSKIYIYQPK